MTLIYFLLYSPSYFANGAFLIQFKNYLEELTKEQVFALRKKMIKDMGLVKIQEARSDLLKIPVNIRGKFSDLEKVLLVAIYSSHSRGVTVEEVSNYVKAFPEENVVQSLQKLETKKLIYARENEITSYHGFKECQEKVYKLTTTSITKIKENLKNKGEWKDISHFLISNLIAMLSCLCKSNVRITSDFKIHRKNVKSVLLNLYIDDNISSTLLTEKFWFLFSFLNSQGCFVRCDGDLDYSKTVENLLQSDENLLTKIFEWWRENKLLDQTYWFSVCTAQKVWNVAELSHMLAACEGFISRKIKFGTTYLNFTKTGLKWEQLPRIIKELWFIGAIQLRRKGSVITHVKWEKNVVDAIVGNKKFTKKNERRNYVFA